MVSLNVHFFTWSIGSESFLNSFFSTIHYHLEPEGRGSRYPNLMNRLYMGKIEKESVPALESEVREVRTLLENYSPTQVIFDNLSKRPPWGDKISPQITSLSNYYVTSDGEDLFRVLLTAIARAKEFKTSIEIENL